MASKRLSVLSCCARSNSRPPTPAGPSSQCSATTNSASWLEIFGFTHGQRATFSVLIASAHFSRAAPSHANCLSGLSLPL
eukprot:6195957-Pleurochrysis_carterae.AAC.1